MNQLLQTLKSYGDMKNFTDDKYRQDWVGKSSGFLTLIEKTPPEKHDILNFLAYIDSQLAKKDFPERFSAGAGLVNILIIHAMGKIRSHVEYENDFDGELFDLLITCLKAGPGSGHIQVLSDLPISREYYKKVDPERVSKLLAAYGGNIYADPPEKGLRLNVEKPFKSVEKELFQPHLQQLRDVWMTLLFRLADCSENVGYFLNSLRCEMETSMEKDLKVHPYLYTDKIIIAGHMDKVKAVMMKEEYPENIYSRQSMRNIVQCMTQYLRKEGSTRKEVINHLNDVILDVAVAGNRQAFKDMITETRVLFRDCGREVKRPSAQNDQLMTVIISMMLEVKNSKEANTFWNELGQFIRENVINPAKPDNWKRTLEFVMVCLDCGHDGLMKLASTVMDRRKTFDWKKSPEVATKIFDKLLTLGEDTERNSSNYGKFTKKFLSHLRGQQVISDYQNRLMEINVKVLSSNETLLLRSPARWTFENTDWGKYKDHTLEVLALMLTALEEYPELPHREGVADSVDDALRAIIHSVAMLHGDASYIAQSLAKLCHICMDREWQTSNNRSTEEYAVLEYIIQQYVNRHARKSDCLEPMLKYVKELWKGGHETLMRAADSILKSAGYSAFLLGEDTVAGIIQSYIDGDDPKAISEFPTYYEQMPNVILTKLEEIVNKANSGDDWVYSGTMSLLYTIARDNIKVIDKKIVDIIAKSMDINKPSVELYILQLVAQERPNDVLPYEDKLISIFMNNKTAAYGINNIFIAMATDEKRAVKYLGIMAKEAPKFEAMQRIGVYHNMRAIGLKYREALAKYKPLFLKEKEDNALAEMAQSVIDVIEGRSLAGLSEDVAEQGEQINVLGDRVEATEENVENLSREVENTQTDVLVLQEESAQAGERLNTLEDVVEETVERVDELDLKTLSHAPAWSPEVSKLLNPDTDHDWKLLASRLGYSADDIKNWATQPDPCLSLLDEWFATHKTREATYAVLKCLEDMSREDAAVIVHDALAAVEDIIDDAPPDLTEPPPVFISYQWGLQPECKLLKKHLEMAGFKSWMDIGQMGGGDKLYAKIDEGIRAAKVVICCVSEKYAQSPNCNREVNLSVTLGKPIIPLLMEKMSWPPPGSMGPIFGEYLFIRFFQRSSETADDSLFWPTAKFQELLMQLRYQIVPDETVVTEEYKNWWAPPDEDIIIKPKDKTEKVTSSTASGATYQIEESEMSASPEVFISYQWGKQPQIKALFQRLSKLGFTCWLDIMQMGGGDSLYDKIDRGVRGCKIVVSCVTNKYSLSANCRREVSLADALKKPIIPLLLEDMTWPPEGPMSMPFTQLLYINFSKPDDSIQNHWVCPQFEELLQKIIGYVRPVKTKENFAVDVPVNQDQHVEVKIEVDAPVPFTSDFPTEENSSRPQSMRSKPGSRPPSANSKPRSKPPSARSQTPKPVSTPPAVMLSTPREKSPAATKKTSKTCHIL